MKAQAYLPVQVVEPDDSSVEEGNVAGSPFQSKPSLTTGTGSTCCSLFSTRKIAALVIVSVSFLLFVLTNGKPPKVVTASQNDQPKEIDPDDAHNSVESMNPVWEVPPENIPDEEEDYIDEKMDANSGTEDETTSSLQFDDSSDASGELDVEDTNDNDKPIDDKVEGNGEPEEGSSSEAANNEQTNDIADNQHEQQNGKLNAHKDERAGEVLVTRDMFRNAKYIWDLPLSPNMRFADQAHTRHPQLAFIKGLKVGGTSIAVALNRAASQYKINLASAAVAVQQEFGSVGPCEKGALHFHHGWKNPWLSNCIENVKFTTLLREPVSQELSFMNFQINMPYFRNYPRRPCHKNQHMNIGQNHPQEKLVQLLETVSTCEDTEFRKNVTYSLIASRLHARQLNRTSFNHASRTWMTIKWIVSLNRMISAPQIIQILQNDYYLVGVTEKLNQFLVLLAVANGWKPSAVYYRKCKPTNLDVHPKQFEQYFPDLVQMVREETAPIQDAYQWVKRDFEQHISKLGPWFQDLVSEFETGLAKYQQNELGLTPYHWKQMEYLDGRTEFC